MKTGRMTVKRKPKNVSVGRSGETWEKSEGGGVRRGHAAFTLRRKGKKRQGNTSPTTPEGWRKCSRRVGAKKKEERRKRHFPTTTPTTLEASSKKKKKKREKECTHQMKKTKGKTRRCSGMMGERRKRGGKRRKWPHAYPEGRKPGGQGKGTETTFMSISRNPWEQPKRKPNLLSRITHTQTSKHEQFPWVDNFYSTAD